MSNATRRFDRRQLGGRLNSHAPVVLSVFRIVVGLLFLCHGTAILFGWPAGTVAPVGQWPDFYAGCLEFGTGVLITVGLFTRVAAFVASGTMAFAFFTVHLPKGIIPMTDGGELAVLYCFATFLLVFTGAGALALDARRR